MLRARDRALLGRLIAAFNTSQRESGELERVDDRRFAGTTYHVPQVSRGNGSAGGVVRQLSRRHVRLLQLGGDDPGCDRAQGRTAAGPARPSHPAWPTCRSSRPCNAGCRLGRWRGCSSIPRAIERLLTAAPRPSDSSDARIVALLARYVAAVDYAGAALSWGTDTIAVHAVETLDPSRLDRWLRRWAGDSRASNPVLRRVP